MTHRISIWVLAATAVVALGLFAAQQSSPPPARSNAANAGGCPCGMMGGGNMAMRGDMQQMQTRMSQMNAQLDRDVAAMNKAGGQAKVDAMAAVINDMAREHREMSRMMGGGMGMAMMGGAGQNATMRNCPMMSGSAPAKPAR